MKLYELQKKMVKSIIEKDVGSDFSELLTPCGKLPNASESLKVYQNGYPARLTEALGESYPAIWRVLGDEDFFQLANDYISQCPSRSYNLSDYDSRFENYLASRKDLLEDFPFLPELANFEWSFHQTFHKKSDDLSSLFPEALAEINENTIFELASTLKFFDFQYSSYKVWKLRNTPPEEVDDFDFSAPQKILLFKIGDQKIQSLEVEDWQFLVLHLLQKREPLGRALEQVENFDLNQEQVSSIFALLTQHQLIKSISSHRA